MNAQDPESTRGRSEVDGGPTPSAEAAPCRDLAAAEAAQPLKFGPCGNCGRSIDHRQCDGSYPCAAHGGWR